MLRELSEYDNLGTPRYFFELLIQLKNNEGKWTMNNVKEFFFNRIVDGRNVFDGCLPLALSIDVLQIDNRGIIAMDAEFADYFSNERYLSAKFLERFLSKLEQDDIFDEIFNARSISYDVVYHSIQVSNSAFLFKYANIKQLLIDFDFLSFHPDRTINRLIVNPKYKKMFDKNILPGVKKRKTGIEEFQKLLEQKQIFGEEAEVFVLSFEIHRLNGHVKIGEVQRVSEYDVGAGYDIVSYENIDSEELDRFIEVKSFTSVPSFYWSRNEMDVARIKKDKYFLYLVDRSRMGEEKFVPVIIQNPFERVLRDDLKWDKRIEKYFVSLR